MLASIAAREATIQVGYTTTQTVFGGISPLSETPLSEQEIESATVVKRKSFVFLLYVR